MYKFTLLSLFLLASITVRATTTSGTTTRNVTINGFVVTDALTGTNDGRWETDEVYPGYSGPGVVNPVNWYLTWDDTNLYLGRTGPHGPGIGSNALGAVITIRAQYPGDQNWFSNTAPNYDGVSNDLSVMGGANFMAYVKNGYNEYRRYNGTDWSGIANADPNDHLSNVLNTAFQDGANDNEKDQMEIAIPWAMITRGNGKPSNIRVAMFHINTTDPTCDPKIFGESPWGTGANADLTDGPRLGVNDGAPISARQPGGCNVQTAPLQRWWGCYPVISGVSSNGFVAMAPDAGTDKFLCETSSSVTLSGNEPSADAVGTWSFVPSKSTAGLVAPVIQNINNKNSGVTGLNGYGSYVFSWNINYGGCPAVPDTIIVTRYQSPSAADAGKDTSLCFPTSAYVLDGNTPLVGKGRWTVLQGAAQLSNATAANSGVTGLSIGVNTFKWTISNSAFCDSTSSVVTVTINTLPDILTQPDSQVVCENQNAVFSITATGSALQYQWQVSDKGGANGSFVNVPAIAPYSATTGPSLTINNVDTVLSGLRFRCYITGACEPADTSAAVSLTVNHLASIIQQPLNDTACLGEDVVFRIKATGTGLQYQWKKNGGDITGAITDSLLISSVALSDSGNYTCSVTGTCSAAVISATANLVVNTAPVITSEPVSKAACPGENVSFSVKAEGTITGFQWQEKTVSGIFVNISNGAPYAITTFADSSTLAVSNVTMSMDSNLYRCIVIGSCIPSDTSASVVLTMNPLIIPSQPSDQTVCANTNTLFGISTIGSFLSHHWVVSTDGGQSYTAINAGGVYSGVQSDTLRITGATPGMNKYVYKSVIKGSCDNSTFYTDSSTAATLNVNALPDAGISSAVQSPVCINSAAAVKVTGSFGQIQWEQSADGLLSWASVNGGIGADSSIYTTPSLSDTMYYRVKVKNGVCDSAYSGIVKVEITPASLTGTVSAVKSPVCINSSAEVKVDGSLGQIQWQQSADDASWTSVTGGVGANNPVYTTPALPDTMYYRVRIKNGVCDSVHSASVKVEITPASQAGVASAVKSPVCINNSTEVKVTGSLGQIQWEQSVDGLSPWSSVTGGVGANNAVYTTPLLPDTMYYRVKVKNGVCDSVYSAIVKVEITPASLAGTATAVKSPVCKNTATTMKVDGYKGAIQWEQSSDGLTAWTAVTEGSGFNSSIYSTPALSNPVYYRASIQNGVCDAANSLPVAIAFFTSPSVNLGKDTMICSDYGSKIILKVNQSYTSYLWSDKSESPTFSVERPGTYWLRVKDQNDCEAGDTIVIGDCTKFKIPNVITPNGDGLNDNFVILGNNAEAAIEIYNRWGSMVYSKNGYLNNWDGHGNVDGIYYYIYVLNKETHKGYVEIIRE